MKINSKFNLEGVELQESMNTDRQNEENDFDPI